jgi:hypothetical protein
MSKAVSCLVFAFLISLSACGGGGSKSTPPPDPPPAITQQPANQSVKVGQTAIFTVVATGTAPLSYQWQKNGAAIPSATAASYTTPAATLADDGAIFQVIVTNAAGVATSDGAELTVTADPPAATPVSIAITPNGATLLLNQTQQFIGVVTYSDGSTDQNVQWSALNGSVSSAGLFTPAALGPAAVTAAATADPSVSQSVIINVTGLISSKLAGWMTPSTAQASQGSYYWDFNLDQDSSGNLAAENGVQVCPTPCSDILATTNLAYPGSATATGTQNGTSFQLTVPGPAISVNNGPAVLTGTENSDDSRSGTFTDADSWLSANAGTFTLTQFSLLNGTWTGSGSNLSVTLALTEVAPTPSTPRQFSGTVQINGTQTTFDSTTGKTQGDLFEITNAVCWVVGRMNDPSENAALVVQIGSPDYSYPDCPLPPSEAVVLTLDKP